MMIKEHRLSEVLKGIFTRDNFSKLSTWVGIGLTTLVVLDTLGMLDTTRLLDIMTEVFSIYLIVLGVPEAIRQDKGKL